ncbi:MAG: reverse transcriptase domain-containing protein [Nannocystaceae bacterium]
MSNRRQELYDRIRSSSKDEVILEEMIRLGFWPRQGEMPVDPAEEIRQRGELQRRLDALRERARKLYNEKQLIKEAKRLRLAEAKRKKAETRQRHEHERQERAARWRETKKSDLIYLGEGVSAALHQREGNAPRLQAAGLPVLATPAEVAKAMGVELGDLRFLSYSRQVARITHYRRFQIPKKSGGTRTISAPMPRLKRAQAWVLREVVGKVALHRAAHGFAEGRSIVSNARPHVGQAVVVNLDLRDFFPTVTFRRVKGMFVGLGYSEAVATIFALLCTEPETTQVELDGRTWYVGLGARALPQGSPASPAITNVLCRRLDKRLQGLADQLGFAYTRYADDLTFSRKETATSQLLGELLRKVVDIVAHEGFTVHPDKTRVMHRGRQQEVTGVVVNDKLAVDRKTLRAFRATLFQIEKDGPQGKQWGGVDGKKLLWSLHGYASFVAMVDRVKGQPLLTRVRALMAKYGGGGGGSPGGGSPGGGGGGGSPKPKEPSASTPTAPASAPASAPGTNGEPKKKRWKLF